jgi:hypothetical protein
MSIIVLKPHTSIRRDNVPISALSHEPGELSVRIEEPDLLTNSEFNKEGEQLQKQLADVVKASKVHFSEPWDMVCLFWAGGSPVTTYGKLSVDKLILERGKTDPGTRDEEIASRRDENLQRK